MGRTGSRRPDGPAPLRGRGSPSPFKGRLGWPSPSRSVRKGRAILGRASRLPLPPLPPGRPLQLVETPDNPIPRRPNVMAVETEDGVTLRAARWRPTTRRDRGTVCILQGRAEFIEKYFETITELRRRGFAVVAFDWRGQGLSGRALAERGQGLRPQFRPVRARPRGDPGERARALHAEAAFRARPFDGRGDRARRGQRRGGCPSRASSRRARCSPCAW